MEHVRLWGVDILLLHAFRAGVKQSSAKGIHLARHREPREDHTSGIAVNEVAVVLAVAQTCLDKVFGIISCGNGCLGERVTTRQGISQLEFLYDVVTYSTAAEILQTYSLSVGIVFQDVLEILLRPLVHHKHTLAVCSLLLFLSRQLALLYLDVVFVGKPSESVGIGDLLVLHEEVDGIATLATGKAMTDALRRRHHERRSLVVVERTQALIVDARLAQRHKFRDDIHDVCRLHYLVYGLSVNHNRCKVSVFFVKNYTLLVFYFVK